MSYIKYIESESKCLVVALFVVLSLVLLLTPVIVNVPVLENSIGEIPEKLTPSIGETPGKVIPVQYYTCPPYC